VAKSPDLNPITAEAEELWISSFEGYAKDLLRIQTKKSTLVPFVRNPVQKIKAAIKKDIRDSGRLTRLIILKARQFGISTDELMEMLWETATTELRNCMVATHDPDSTNYLFRVVKRAHDNIPIAEWKPDKKASNAKELIFEGLDSAIRVGTAGKDNLGSGTVIHRALLSELAKWPKHSISDILTSLFQCIPKTKDSELTIESTANGVGGEYHDMYLAARYRYEVFLANGRPDFKCTINPDALQDNEFSSVFIPWFVHYEYQMDPDPGFRRTEEEQGLAQVHGIGDSHLAWRRHTIANECRGSIAAFHQEYPSTAQEAFLSSGRPVFDVKKCQEKIRTCKKPVAFYDCATNIGQFLAKTPQIEGDTDGLLQVWEEPKQGIAYVIPADVSEGKEISKSGKKTDFHSIDVLEQLTGRQVAHWHGKIEPIQLGILLSYIGYRYNTAWVVPERNNHGTAVVGKLSEIKYPNLYCEETPNPPHKPVKRYGWLTRGGSMGDAKALVIDNLVEMVNKGMDGIVCAETLKELVTYKHEPDGTMGAEAGCFDDRVMSYAIGQWVRKRLPLPSNMRPSSNQPAAVPVGAYT
jgi:hypothetical protein